MPVFSWSQTAANNATADATINWAEGQAPSTLNDSARALMAAVAKWRDDISGFFLVSSGGPNAYTLGTFSVFNSLANMHGQMVSFRVNVTNSASPTLNVDGLGAKPIVTDQTGTALGANVWTLESVQTAVYDNNSGQWIIKLT